jgi:hypothetical protein
MGLRFPCTTNRTKEMWMRRAVLLITALCVLASSAFGQDGVLLALQKAKTHSPAAHQPVPALEVVGRVDAVTLEDPAKGVRSEISIIDEAGARYILIVKPTTTIYGPDWKAITLDKLSKDQQVRVQYAKSKEGSFTALSIKPSGTR